MNRPERKRTPMDEAKVMSRLARIKAAIVGRSAGQHVEKMKAMAARPNMMEAELLRGRRIQR